MVAGYGERHWFVMRMYICRIIPNCLSSWSAFSTVLSVHFKEARIYQLQIEASVACCQTAAEMSPPRIGVVYCQRSQ